MTTGVEDILFNRPVRDAIILPTVGVRRERTSRGRSKFEELLGTVTKGCPFPYTVGFSVSRAEAARLAYRGRGVMTVKRM